MKAVHLIKYGKSETAFAVSDVAIPKRGEDEILVKNEVFGLNFADVMARKGLYKAAPKNPAILGYEVVGSIVDSSNVQEIGKRVLAFCRFGGYAEFTTVKKNAFIFVNDNDDAAELTALATQYCTAYFAAFIVNNINENDVVLQHAAAGGVGIALTQLCKLKGAFVIGLASNDNKKEFLLNNGCNDVININKKNYFEYIKLKNKEVDVVFNSVGGKSFANDFKLLRAGGRVVGYGAAERMSGKFGFLSTLIFVLRMKIILPVKLLMSSKSIIGVNMLEIADNRPDLLEKCMREVYDLYTHTKIKPKVHKCYTVSEIAKAHSDLESRQTIGKLTIKW